MNYESILAKLDMQKIPKHIGIIMDGNGRWAEKNNLNHLQGHAKGVQSVRDVVKVAGEIGVKFLTVYAFSTENWKRSDEEVNGLLALILDSLLNEIEALNENNVRIRFIGSKKGIKPNYLKQIEDACQKSEKNTGLCFNVAFNYGGRKEIIEAVNTAINKGFKQIDEKIIEKFLYTSGQDDPDLIIRTSGEERLSNFMLWQSAYSEFYFTAKLWPEFDKYEFVKAINEFQNRKRRFGGR